MAYGNQSVDGPRLVGYNLASQSLAYMMRLLDVGMVEGPLGDAKLNPRLMPLLEGIHHVLAGGSVEVKVVTPGSPDVYNDLMRRQAAAGVEANEINAKSGYYVTLSP